MAFKRTVITLLISALVTVFFWKTQIVISDKLPQVFLICFIVLLTAGDLLFSKEKRNEFKQTYRNIDQYNPDRRHRPKPKVLIGLAAVGLIISLLLGIPILPYVFTGLLLIFLFHAAMMK